MKHQIRHTLLIGLAALTATYTSSAQTGKLYKWVDKQGNVSYQDQPPPKSAKSESELKLSKRQSSNNSVNQNREPVLVYTVENCPNCVIAIRHLKKIGVPYIELPLKDDRAAQSKILARTDSLVAPTLFIGDSISQAPSAEELTELANKEGYIKSPKKEPAVEQVPEPPAIKLQDANNQPINPNSQLN